MKILSLDVGEKRIGVAKADSDTKIALPVGYVVVDGTEWQEIARLSRLINTNFFVIGLPRSNEGKETAQSAYVRNFAKNLIEKIPGARVRFQDESLTSVEAEARLKKRQKKYEKGDIDAEAATIILQDFIESLQNTGGTANLGAVQNSGSSKADNSATGGNKNSKPVKVKSKKKLGILLIVLAIVLLLGGTTAILKVRDYIRQQREEEIARQEAAMKPVTFNFTIRPGETIYDIKKELLSVDRNIDRNEESEPLPSYTAEEIDEALNGVYDFEFLADKPEGTTIEGYLYPETYNFYADSTVHEIFEKYLTGMGEVVKNSQLVERYAARGLTLYQGITLASVVQKEAVPGEQPTVAQVFLTRLNYGWRLGSDVTVSYAVDKVDPDRNIYRDNAAALSIDSCYNTRINAGLPCGPISNPGFSALEAVAEPTDSAYLYFLTGDDGVMYYSYTEAEHNQNARLHCQTLCNVSL